MTSEISTDLAANEMETAELPSSTPEFAPVAAQVLMDAIPAPSSPQAPSPDPANPATIASVGSEAGRDQALYTELGATVYEILRKSPHFDLHSNVRAVLEEVQHLRSVAQTTQEAMAGGMPNAEITAIRETVQTILTLVQQRQANDEEKSRAPDNSPTEQLIQETRSLVRSVKQDVDAAQTTHIQLNNQLRTVMRTATQCLRELDETLQRHAQEEAGNALREELTTLREGFSDRFENARLEPIAPEPGEPFRLSEHQPDKGFAANGKIRRVVLPGFRWTSPTPTEVLLPAIVETE